MPSDVPLDAILDGSGVQYYSKRTRQLTNLEKKLEAAREAFYAARKAAGHPDPPKISPGYGSAPPGSDKATNQLRKAYRQQQLAEQAAARAASQHATSAGKPAAAAAPGTGAAASSPLRGAAGGSAAAATAGGAGAAATAADESNESFRRFTDALGTRGPVVVAKPYHTEARTFFNLSLLPTAVANMQADSGLYYSPAGSGGGVRSVGLREGMIRYFQPNLALDRQEKQRQAEQAMAERVAQAQESLNQHIESLVGHWGLDFLDRLVEAAAADSAARSGAGPPRDELGGAQGANVHALALDARAAARRRLASPQDDNTSVGSYGPGLQSSRPGSPGTPDIYRYGSYGPFAPAYDATKSFTGGLTSAVVGDSAMQRLHEIAQQCQVPMDTLVGLLKNRRRHTAATAAGAATVGGSPYTIHTSHPYNFDRLDCDAHPSSSEDLTRGPSVVVGVAGARQDRRLELQPARTPVPAFALGLQQHVLNDEYVYDSQQDDEEQAEQAMPSSRSRRQGGYAGSRSMKSLGRQSRAASIGSALRGEASAADWLASEASHVTGTRSGHGGAEQPPLGAQDSGSLASWGEDAPEQRASQHVADAGQRTSRSLAAEAAADGELSFWQQGSAAETPRGPGTTGTGASPATSSRSPRSTAPRVTMNPHLATSVDLGPGGAATVSSRPGLKTQTHVSATASGVSRSAASGLFPRRHVTRMLAAATPENPSSGLSSRLVTPTGVDASPGRGRSPRRGAGHKAGRRKAKAGGGGAAHGSAEPEPGEVLAFRSGLSFVAMGRPAQAPSLEGLQPKDPREIAQEAASRALMESLEHRHDHDGLARHVSQQSHVLVPGSGRGHRGSSRSRGETPSSVSMRRPGTTASTPMTGDRPGNPVARGTGTGAGAEHARLGAISPVNGDRASRPSHTDGRRSRLSEGGRVSDGMDGPFHGEGAGSGEEGGRGGVQVGLRRLSVMADQVGLTIGGAGAKGRRGRQSRMSGLALDSIGSRGHSGGEDSEEPEWDSPEQEELLVQAGWLGPRMSSQGATPPEGTGGHGHGHGQVPGGGVHVPVTLGPLPTWSRGTPAGVGRIPLPGMRGSSDGDEYDGYSGAEGYDEVGSDEYDEAEADGEGSDELGSGGRGRRVRKGFASVLPRPDDVPAGGSERLSRQYKDSLGSLWNPSLPGALRPTYGTTADYVAGTYNPDLMERVAVAREIELATGQEVPVEPVFVQQTEKAGEAQGRRQQRRSKQRKQAGSSARSRQRRGGSSYSPPGSPHATTSVGAEEESAGMSEPDSPTVRDQQQQGTGNRTRADPGLTAACIAAALNPITTALHEMSGATGPPGTPQAHADMRGLPAPLAAALSRAMEKQGGAGTTGLPGTAPYPGGSPSRAGRVASPSNGRPPTVPELQNSSRAAAASLARFLVAGSLPAGATAWTDISKGFNRPMTDRSASPYTARPDGPDANDDPTPDETVEPKVLRPSQSVWGREELDKYDILAPLRHHLASTAPPGSAAAAQPPKLLPSAAYTAAGRGAKIPVTTDHLLNERNTGTANTDARGSPASGRSNVRRAMTAPTGVRPGTAAATAAAAAGGGQTKPPTIVNTTLNPAAVVPEPRLWRGDPLELKAAFPQSEKVYRLVTDVQATARLLRDVERDLTPMEFKSRYRRGLVL